MEILTHLSDRDLNIMASALHAHLTNEENVVKCVIDHPECRKAIKAMIEEFEK